MCQRGYYLSYASAILDLKKELNLAFAERAKQILNTSQHYFVKHSVSAEKDGLRLDVFLKHRYQKRSREEIKRSIDSGEISVQRNQSPHLSVGRVKPSSQLLAGDDVLIRVDRKPEPKVSFDYQILFEDESLFVINKPPLLPVHPAGRYFFNTLLIHLRTHGHKTPLNADQDYYLAHRIDKETSGVLVLTKTKEVCAHLSKQFAERGIKKTYLAVVHGHCAESFINDQAMQRAGIHSQIQLKMRVAPEIEGGLPAFTSFTRKSIHGDYSLVECLPRTGRQHQIRVHLAASGHPIVGDKLYGLPESEALRFFDRIHFSPESAAKLVLPRHALHAASIQFQHPFLKKEMEFHAPIPQDLTDFLNQQSNQPGHSPGLVNDKLYFPFSQTSSSASPISSL